MHFARLLQLASLFGCFSVLFFLQLHKPVLPENDSVAQFTEIAFYLTRYAARQRRRAKREAPKVSGRARPTAGEGKYLSFKT